MTQKNRVLLNVRRFKQKPAECGIAAISSIANYYDSTLQYKQIRQLLKARDRASGTYTSQQARLLNQLGFTDVSIVTADLTLIDFSWKKLGKKRIINKLKDLASYYGRCKEPELKFYVSDMMEWLSDEECNNRLVIDYDFAKHIRKGLDAGRPVGAAIAWTSLFQRSKGREGWNDDIRGVPDDHAIVLRGYDDEGVFVVDSHYECYKGKLKKYHNGYYKVTWEKFLVNIPRGDLIIVM